MKYSILGFNQTLAVQHSLDLTDLLLLDYIYTACGSPSMEHICDENNQPYIWLRHSKILDDLPVLSIGEEMLKKRIKNLIDKGFLKSKLKCTNSVGRKAYYTVTESCESLRFSNQVEQITLAQNDQVEKITLATSRPKVMDYPSDNQLILDNKLDNTISKDIVAKAPTENPIQESDTESLTEYEQHMYSDDVRKKRKIEGAQPQKTKKLSLWDKCVQDIEAYTADEELREALKDYLKLRLAMKDKPMYQAQWRALLKKIGTCAGDPVAIVKQSTELGYASFYDLKSYTSRPRRVDIISSETENMSCRKVSEEERREILENGEVF